MPNGFYGQEKEWERMEAPLLEIDELLREFAERHSMKFSKNYHNWPNRRIRWGEGLCKLIEVSLADQKSMTFHFAICAWKDRGRERYWKNKVLQKGVPFSEIKADLRRLLDDGRKTLESWTEKDLGFATRLAKS